MKNCLQLYLMIFLFLFQYSVLSQKPQPGGVSGTKLWYVTEKTGNFYTLKDISGNQRKSYGSNTSRNINFHPAFRVEQNTIDPFENFAFNQYTIAGIFYPNQTSDAPLFYNFGSGDSVTTLRSNRIGAKEDRTKFTFGNPVNRTTLDLTAPTTMLENAMKTAVYHQAIKRVFNSIWGEDKKTTFSSRFSGYMPELVVYNRVLSPLERCKVESYLAIKYGTTLDTSYVGSNGEVLWSISDPNLKKFHHRVCAIGKDSTSAIWQLKSNSTYEEEVFKRIGITNTAFHKDALNEYILDDNGFTFIPSKDSPSIYRSVTIGFKDKSFSSTAERRFLFLGDDSLSTKPADFAVRYTSRYPSLKTVQRNWIVYNKDRIQASTTLMIAGGNYEDRTLFTTLYHPYDYQLYRYVLVKFNPNNTNEGPSLHLASYFGREQNKSHRFETRTIVWDSIVWNDTYNYFTLGRVPLLNFLIFGKTAKATDSIPLKYYFYPSQPIRTEALFDTISNHPKFIFRKGIGGQQDEAITAYFRVSEGVGNLRTRIEVLENNRWLEERSATIRVAQGSTDDLPIPPSKNESSTLADSSAQGSVETIVNSEILEPINRYKPVTSQPYKAYNVSGLIANKIYKIIIIDDIGQKTSLPFKTIQR